MKILLLHTICQTYPVPDGTKFKICVTIFVDQQHHLVELHKKCHILVYWTSGQLIQTQTPDHCNFNNSRERH